MNVISYTSYKSGGKIHGKVLLLSNLYRSVCTVQLNLNVWFNFCMILAQKKPIKKRIPLVEQAHYVFIKWIFFMEVPLSWPCPLRGRFSLPPHPTCRLVDRQAVSDCQRPAFYHDHHMCYADDRDDGHYSSLFLTTIIWYGICSHEDYHLKIVML